MTLCYSKHNHTCGIIYSFNKQIRYFHELSTDMLFAYTCRTHRNEITYGPTLKHLHLMIQANFKH